MPETGHFLGLRLHFRDGKWHYGANIRLTSCLSLSFPEAGATTPDQDQAETKRAMIAAARQVILVCDSSKLSRVSFVQFASLAELDAVALDSAPAAMRGSLGKVGVQILLPQCR